VELTILGCGGSYSSARTQCSGYLLRHEGYTVWMDAGNGTLSQLQKHVTIDQVDAIVLSHAHPDHCADLYPFFYAVLFSGRGRPVITPPGVREKLRALIGDDSVERFNTLLGWTDLEHGRALETGPFRFEAFDSVHSARNNTLRVTADGRTLCYSGDTGPNEHLARAAKDADVFLCEASWTDAQKGLMGGIHLSGGEAGEAARAAGAGRLILTHLWASNDYATIRAQAAETYGGKVELAVDLESVEI